MTVFACADCGNALSTSVRRVALPIHAHQKWGNGVAMPVLMDPGTYAVDPHPSGPPWKRWAEVGEQEAARQGVFAPRYGVSFGSPGAAVVTPGDTRGTLFIPERLSGYCCGLDGGSGPNLACAQCRQPVATRIDDCSLWQAVWFEPDAVIARAAGDSSDRPADWADALVGLPPLDDSGDWRPQWTAAIGACVAHLLAESGNAPIAVPDGLCASLLAPTLQALLPGTPKRTAAFAGPMLPEPAPDADILIVPRHPVTGEPWRPRGSARLAPLSTEVWTYLVQPHARVRFVRAHGTPVREVCEDVFVHATPWCYFSPDMYAFLETLCRLPAAREPWLRSIYDQIARRPHSLVPRQPRTLARILD